MKPVTERTAHTNTTLAAALRAATIAVLSLAVAGVALPGDVGTAAEWAMVALLIATPLARVAWLAVRWSRRRDWLFVGLAAGLLALTGLAAVITALTH